MTDSEKLDLLLAEIRGTKDEVQSMKKDIRSLKDDMKEVKEDIRILKEDVRILKEDVQLLKKKVTCIELHLENSTDHNIQLIAENFIDLTNKLNQAIPAADNNRMYEVKVKYLIEEVKKLADEVSKIKEKTA